jgi:glycosyltransferase involved in cell wall biosynthesis
MKVLHVNAGLEKGGGLTHIVNLLAEAKQAGQDFELLVFAEGPVAQAARERGIKVAVLGASSRYDLFLPGRLKKFINEGGYDLVHTHGARANLFMSLVHRKLKAKWAVTVHSDPMIDFEGRGLAGRIFTKLNLRAIKQADCVFAVTQRFGKMLAERDGVDPAKLHVIYNGITFHTDAQIPAKVPHHHFNLINVGRLEKVKGQDLLIRAVKQVDDQRVQLHIAGDGSQLDQLRQLVADLDMGGQVFFHGFMSQSDLQALYAQMDLAVLSSYSESFPLVLLEASDNLLPLLATDVGDMHEMIPDKEHGLIAEVGSVDSLAACLKQYLQKSPAELEDLALREKAYLAGRFSLAKQLASIMAVYQQILRH